MFARALVFALCLTHGWAQRTKAAKCATGVHVLAVRGHGVSNPPYGLSSTTVSNITAAIPGSDVVPVKYPANIDNDYQAAQIGAAHLKRYIRQYVHSCPDTKIVLQGYSQGAMAVMAGICGSELPGQTQTAPFPSKFAENIVAIVTYGDETRNAAATYNAGTCQNSAPYAARTTWECGDYTDMIRAWCDSTDPACCIGGNDMATHYQYPQEYDYDVRDFVVQEYDAAT